MSDTLENMPNAEQEAAKAAKLQKAREMIASVKSKIRVTKVVATRSVKGPAGDAFVGYSAEWDSCQDDGAQGLDSDPVGTPVQAMTLQEAKVAACLMGLQADVSAYRNAMCSGAVGVDAGKERIQGVKANYAKMIQEILDEV